MKKELSVLLALALCLSAAPAFAEDAPEPPAASEVQAEAPEPVPEPREAPAPEAHVEEPAPLLPPKPEQPGEALPEEPPAPEVTEAPRDEPEQPAEGEEPPRDEAQDEPSDEPTDGEPSDEPTGEPADEPTDDPPLPPEEPEPEGYVLGPQGKVRGTLAELLATPGEKTVYISAKEPVKLPDFALKLLKDVSFLPDPDVYDAPDVEFAVALCDGEGAEITAEIIEEATDELVELVICVESKPKEVEPGPTEPGGDEDVRLTVTPVNFAGDGVWQCEIPEFALSGIPEDGEGYCYVAIVYDERFIPLSGDSYLPMEEGVYSLRFAIMNPQGDIVNGASDKYELWLDYTPPMLNVEVSASQDYTMTLNGFDELSGVTELSLDGGETWTQAALGEGLSVVHTESKRKVFPAGMIRIRDLAGNESWNMEEVVLDKLPEMPSFGGFGYGGGEPSATAAPHASGDGDDAPYDAYELALPEGAVEELTLGGEPIELGLEIEEEERPEDAPARFTAELTAWAKRGEAKAVEDAEPEKDTLVIRAQTRAQGGPCVCRWRVNGAVLRKLYNSDIRYLALSAGDALLSLPTVGFTAGTRYAELKMRGVSTAEFEYEITMTLDPEAELAPQAGDWNLSGDCRVEICVEVGGERFSLLDRQSTPEMYPIDVYCGPDDLPDYPYGEYPRPEEEEMSDEA